MQKITKILLILASIIVTLICGYIITNDLIMGNNIQAGVIAFIIMVCANWTVIDLLTDRQGWYL